MVHALHSTFAMRVVTALVTVTLLGCLPDLPPGPANPQHDAGVMRPLDADTNTALEILRTWSGCMTLANFQAAGMTNAWGTLAATNKQVCANCHQYGAFGFIATKDETAFFDAITQHSSMMAMYFTADVPNRNVIVNLNSFKAANVSAGHPAFDPVSNPGMTALDKFHAATAAIATCDPPKLVD
jgi:hypothetical protein